MHPPAPPPDSSFELLVIGLGIPPSEVGFLEQFTRVRAHLRREVDRRLRELAGTDPVPYPCPGCGDGVECSPSYLEKVRRGSVPAPLCYECRRPTRAAEAEAGAALFIELLGDSAEELAAAIAALA